MGMEKKDPRTYVTSPAALGWMFWTLAPSFLEPVCVFLDLAQGGWNLDTETRCMQEVADAGEVPVLKQ